MSGELAAANQPREVLEGFWDMHVDMCTGEPEEYLTHYHEPEDSDE